jgi:hypothetical protein
MLRYAAWLTPASAGGIFTCFQIKLLSKNCVFVEIGSLQQVEIGEVPNYIIFNPLNNKEKS